MKTLLLLLLLAPLPARADSLEGQVCFTEFEGLDMGVVADRLRARLSGAGYAVNRAVPLGPCVGLKYSHDLHLPAAIEVRTFAGSTIEGVSSQQDAFEASLPGLQSVHLLSIIGRTSSGEFDGRVYFVKRPDPL